MVAFSNVVTGTSVRPPVESTPRCFFDGLCDVVQDAVAVKATVAWCDKKVSDDDDKKQKDRVRLLQSSHSFK